MPTNNKCTFFQSLPCQNNFIFESLLESSSLLRLWITRYIILTLQFAHTFINLIKFYLLVCLQKLFGNKK